MADKVSLGEVARGDVDLEMLLKLNALLNMQSAHEGITRRNAQAEQDYVRRQREAQK